MARHDRGATHSDLWYRLGPTRPRLGSHARVTRQSHGGASAYVVEDPAGGGYYRLSEPAYLFLGLLDGATSVDEAWRISCERLGDDAPTQRECVELLARLQMFGLLTGDVPLAADMIEERRRRARSTRWKRRTGMWISPNVPLVNPEPVLRRVEHLLRPLFSVWALVAWCGLVLAGLVTVGLNLDRLSHETGRVLDPANLVWLGVVFLIVRAVHELGHAAACKAMGGRCTEIGLILIAGVVPLPYCDATSAWRFPEVWRRVLVSAAGMMAELPLAAIAALVWAATDVGSLAHAIAFNLMVISGVMTLVFNANPLMRYDGYYILSDLTGVVNLQQRSRELWIYLVNRYAFGVRNAQPPHVRGPGEAWMLGVFAVLSTPYRIFITVGISLLIANRYPVIGLPLAAVMLVATVIVPLLRGAWYVLTDARLAGRRGRAVAWTAGAVGAIVGIVGLVPAPASASAMGYAKPVRDEQVRAGESGFIQRVRCEVGDRVSVGDVLFEMRSPELDADLRVARARLEAARASLDAAWSQGPAARRVAEAEVKAAEDRERRLAAQHATLTVRADAPGVVSSARGVASRVHDMEGAFVTRGSALVRISSPDDVVVRASISDVDRAFVLAGRDFATIPASVRVRGRAWREIDAEVVRSVPIASDVLDDASLAATLGGDVVVDPTDPRGRRTLIGQHIIEVRTTEGPALLPGQRARVRLGAPSEPLASQWWRSIRRYLSDRLVR
ncbi:MAG: efflux RND transporter periplasmic adaptor subunit [Phycisphaerales bacterium]|jgi:putative peptide zinc metalloprotease protein|nr:efflux RND transporter periplasmic adaptor subunit [Phycisphaerales bacterium]